MSLFDIFRRPRTDWEEIYRRLIRLETTVEALEDRWTAFRDQIRKSAQRIEKIEQRAEEKALRNDSPAPDLFDGSLNSRVLARRAKRGLPQPTNGNAAREG